MKGFTGYFEAVNKKLYWRTRMMVTQMMIMKMEMIRMMEAKMISPVRKMITRGTQKLMTLRITVEEEAKRRMTMMMVMVMMMMMRKKTTRKTVRKMKMMKRMRSFRSHLPRRGSEAPDITTGPCSFISFEASVG
ncbi:hypothetical protein MUK42_16047 [Musa troglodytarum]|uniref:Uncharacterized protein n=1 Tax=Musa troglodytarum TaxID=320322 RepID=A0A9E7HQT9_9LILI|nr:hypothetical protein MUK42_16047 [Musa troglodytarum]